MSREGKCVSSLLHVINNQMGLKWCLIVSTISVYVTVGKTINGGTQTFCSYSKGKSTASLDSSLCYVNDRVSSHCYGETSKEEA